MRARCARNPFGKLPVPLAGKDTNMRKLTSYNCEIALPLPFPTTPAGGCYASNGTYGGLRKGY
jgi:hypothetical protein